MAYLAGADGDVQGGVQLAGEEAEDVIRRLIRRAAPFENRLGDFLESLLLERESDDYDPRADRVTLMTLHAAQGRTLLPIAVPERPRMWMRNGACFTWE